MKTAKYRVLLSVVMAVALAMIVAAFSIGFFTAKADSVSDYITGISSDKVEYADDEIKITMSENDTAKFVQKLAVTEKNGDSVDAGGLEIVLDVPASVEEFAISLTADSFDVNGNKAENGEYKTSIVNTVTFTADFEDDGGDINYFYSISYNGKQTSIPRMGGTHNELSVLFFRNGNYIDLEVEVTGGEDEKGIANDNPYYQVKGLDKIIASVSIEMIAVEDDGEAVLSLVSVAQAKDSDFIQTFERDEEETGFVNKANPIITMADSCFASDKNFLLGKEYTVSLSNFSFIGNSYSLVILPAEGYDYKMNVVNDNMKIIFREEGEVKFKVCDSADHDKVYGEYTVTVIDEISGDGQVSKAPEYNMEESAIESFIAAYEYKLIDHSATGDMIYVRLGSSEYLTLPSMRSMVSDNTTPYDELKYTVYYKTPAADSTYTSGLKIPLATAGEYKFFVIFEDLAGNKMTIDQFYRVDVVDGNIIEDGEYSPYIFSFTILDNSPMTVNAPSSQSDGYLGVAYTASSFTIKASSYETKYTLYFSETEDAEEDKWIEIPSLSTVQSEYDEDYNENGFTYDDLIDIAYDGSLTFTPVKMGYYKIECTVTSTSSSRVPVKAQSVIKVNEKPEVVVVDDHWLQNNVWSVVFLSIGSASLIGIIVLLCIKPKEEEEAAPTEKTRSKRKSK